MPYTLKENEDDARERLRAFWAGESLGRPALLIGVPNPEHEPSEWPGPKPPKKERDLLPEWHAWRCDKALKANICLAEAMPGATIAWGSLLVTVGTLAGADYEYHDGQSAWIQRVPDLWERPLPQFDPTHRVAQSLEACIRRVADVVGDRAFVNPPVFLDGMTTLSQFRTPAQLCIDCVERPDDVCRWRDALTGIYIDAHDHFYRLLCDLGYGDACTWLGVMAEGRMEAVQCDFAVMLSPAMFEQFPLPELRRLTEYMDYSLYHLDGTCQMRFLDLLRSLPGLNGIQWNPEPGVGGPTEWIGAFKEIRSRGFSLYVWCTVDEGVEITREIGPDGLCLNLGHLESRDEAEEAIRRVQEAVP